MIRMLTRHATVLALVGWYLMAVPAAAQLQAGVPRQGPSDSVQAGFGLSGTFSLSKWDFVCDLHVVQVGLGMQILRSLRYDERRVAAYSYTQIREWHLYSSKAKIDHSASQS
jgi:hypothetical protein